LQQIQGLLVDTAYFLPDLLAYRSTKYPTSKGISSVRSRKGGISRVKQVAAKGAAGDRCFQITISGRNHSHVSPNRLISTHTLKFTLPQNPQEGNLSLGGKVSYFVQEDRSSFSQLKSADTALQGSR
jgi:hypothetical protein